MKFLNKIDTSFIIVLMIVYLIGNSVQIFVLFAVGIYGVLVSKCDSNFIVHLGKISFWSLYTLGAIQLILFPYNISLICIAVYLYKTNKKGYIKRKYAFQERIYGGIMKALTLNEIREKYLEFFESKGHLRLSSFSLVPQNDNSLLLINAGMAPLKSYFTGQEIPPSKRIATCQKCIRTGDIENVGKTARHGTFFEMLGNFSFGDYFKEEIIPWSWEFVTEVMNIPEEKLYISVYEEDDEAFDIWNKKVGIAKDRIIRLGKEDNFWEHGLGPCGPCSEIHYDRGEKYGCGKEDCRVGCNCDRYLEFWNLVFTQFNKEEDGTYSKLENPSIDTGMGLERMAAMMQDVHSIFDVDTVKAIRDKICELANVKYGENSNNDISIRIITDHIRSITFMTSDGVLPSNEGRGYVLRRLLRRAARHGKKLDIKEKFLSQLSDTVISISKDAYPELLEKRDYISKVLTVEEDRFYETIDQGMAILKGYVENLRKSGLDTLSGEDAFKLYDTYGFPPDLMQEILAEDNLKIDEEAFDKNMDEQRERARAAREESTYMGSKETIYNKLDASLKTEFVGYHTLETTDAIILAIMTEDNIIEKAETNNEISVLTDKTPFYAESGGQKGDAGRIKTSTGTVAVYDCIKVLGDKFIHVGKVIEGYVSKGDKAQLSVDKKRRMSTTRNHSATHLLQQTLKTVLGEHVQQAGSMVSENRLRFDFTHFSALTREELEKTEKIVNEKILEGLSVSVVTASIDEARKMGATALFGEKYGSEVRVVSMGEFSIELCGGTHLENSSQAGVFKIVSENGVAAGVRRIEAVTGETALEYYRNLENNMNVATSMLKSSPDNFVKSIESLITKTKDLQRQIEKLNSKMSGDVVTDILNTAYILEDVTCVVAKVENMDANALREVGDKLKDKLKSATIVLISSKEDKVNIISMVTDDAIAKGVHAGNIIKAVSKVVGGGGGGRPNMAQAGGKDVSKIEEAMLEAKAVIKEMLSV